MPRDKYGHYKNEEDVEIRTSKDKRDKYHIDIYDDCPADKEDHGSIHINWDSENGKGTIVDTTDDKKDVPSGEKETTEISCFLTTACMKYLMDDFDDNCEELTTLRWFRDNFVSEEDIAHYYSIAPIIVEAIDNLENNETIYHYIYNNVIDACVKAIQQEDYEFAYTRYKNSVLTLEEQFAKPSLEQRLIKVLKTKTNN